MAETSETQFELHVLSKLLRPSYLSGSIAFLSAMAVMIPALLTKLYWSSGWLADTLQTIGDSNTHLLRHDTGDGSSLLNTILLFLFWGCVGLATYFFIIGLARAIKQAKELEQEISYVHGNRRALLRDFAEKLVARIAALALAFATLALYLKVVLPYAISASRSAQLTVRGILSTVLATGILLLTVHLLTVLLRILALRPRLFTSEIES